MIHRLRRAWWLPPVIEMALWTAGALVLAFIAVTALSGCPARPPVTDCTPNASQCSPAGRPQVCSPERRWYDTAAEPCPEGSQCCLAPSDDGPPLHACVPATACLPESLAPAPGAPADPPSEPVRDPFPASSTSSTGGAP